MENLRSNKILSRSSDSRKKKNEKEKAMKEKLNLETQKDESILDKVRAKAMANYHTLSEEERVNPANQLKGIPQEEIEAALAMRANKLLASFATAIDQIPRIENILREWIVQCRDENHKYLSPESFERAKQLGLPAVSCRYLVSAFGAFTKSLNSGDTLTIATAILGAGVLKEKLEKFTEQVSAVGIDVQTLDKANAGMKEALDGVQDYQISTEYEYE